MKAYFGFYLAVFSLTVVFGGNEQPTSPLVPELVTESTHLTTNVTGNNHLNDETFERASKAWDQLDYYDINFDFFYEGPVCDEFYTGGMDLYKDMEVYKNCVFIHGSLNFFMSYAGNNYTKEDFEKISFPSIKQVSGYVLIYDTFGFTSFDKLFPNLSVINGNTLYAHTYSLVIMQNSDLKNLGFKNLSNIRNGVIRIQSNPKLCNLDTVDWDLLGSFDKNFIFSKKLIMFNKDSGCIDGCKSECNGHCWGFSLCQKPACPSECEHACSETGTCHCHEECLGGCSAPNDPNECHGCKTNVNMNATCVAECGEDEYLSDEGRICMDYDRCIITYGYIYKNKCVRLCPSGYKRATRESRMCVKCLNETCPSICGEGETEARIDDIMSAKRWKGCEVIIPRLHFTISHVDDRIYEELENCFGEVYELSTLVIEQTNLDSLKFFKKLRIITGDNEFVYTRGNKSYTMFVLDNKVLDELWFGKPDERNYLAKPMTTSIKGLVFFHFNPHLCNNIIDHVRNASTFIEDDNDISVMSNAPACIVIWMNIWVTSKMMSADVGESIAYFEWEKPDIPEQHNYGYHFYYKISESQNATRLRRDDMNTCGKTRWQLRVAAVADTTVEAEGLLPNTQYAYYIKAKVPQSTNTRVESPIQYFNTSVAIPPAPDYYMARTVDQSTIRVSWWTPGIPSGPFAHYRIRVRRLCEDESIISRGCAKSSVENPSKYEPEPSPPSMTTLLDDGILRECQREAAQAKQESLSYRVKERNDMRRFENMIVDHLFPEWKYSPGPPNLETDDNDVLEELLRQSNMNGTELGKVRQRIEKSGFFRQRQRRSIADERIRNSAKRGRPPPGGFDANGDGELDTVVLKDPNEAEKIAKNVGLGPNEYVTVDYDSITRLEILQNFPHNLSEVCSFETGADGNATCEEQEFEQKTNETSILLTNLCHYTDYRITLLTCVHDPAANNKVYCTKVDYASVTTKRTAPDFTVDRVTNLSAKVNKTSPGQTTVMVKFDPPKAPNGLIKYYTLLYRKVDTTDQVTKCCSTTEFNEKKMCVVEVHLPGTYEVQVLAISLLGEHSRNENASPFVEFTIEQVQQQQHMLEVVILCLAALLALATCGIVIYVKKSHADNNKRATYLMTVNPEYTSVGTYQPDAYEIPINKVSTSRKIGNGHFGEVYEGLAKDIVAGEDETRVAIKTLIGNDNPLKRQEFLKEANTMKAFNSYHVVRLLGVVSMTDKPMVIMEYMGNGDLKTFLRSSRPDADEPRIDPITYEHKLQMCCEIADGMAYLSDCKFVHRDLAARNCLVHQDLTVKIGDFGLTRDVYETDYYRIESRGIMPVRWMSPESLKDGVFNSRSDVWSYGIVLWEIATLAEQPYQGKQHEQVTRYVIDGGYMERPKECPDRLYELMATCWLYNPSMRPTFLEIVSLLSNDVSEGFKDHAYYYERNRNKQTSMEMEAMGDEELSVISSNGQESRELAAKLEKDPLLLGNDVIDRSYPLFLNSQGQKLYHNGGGKVPVDERFQQTAFNGSGDGDEASFRKYTLENNPYTPTHMSEPNPASQL